jgi:hypothetical protein
MMIDPEDWLDLGRLPKGRKFSFGKAAEPYMVEPASDSAVGLESSFFGSCRK